MTAKHKLKSAYVNGAVGTAILLGLATQSWIIFGVALCVIVGTAVHSGDIR